MCTAGSHWSPRTLGINRFLPLFILSWFNHFVLWTDLIMARKMINSDNVRLYPLTTQFMIKILAVNRHYIKRK